MDPHRVSAGPSKDQSISPTLVYSHESDSPLPSLMDLDTAKPAPAKRPLVQDPSGWNICLTKPKRGKVVKTKNPTPVSNSFEPLANAPTEPATNAPNPKPRRPPPIVLDRALYSTSRLANSLRGINIVDFRVQNSPKGLMVYISSQADYEKATETLKATQSTERPVFFHTYAPKGSKPNQKFLLIGFDEEHNIDSIRTALTHPDLIDVRRLTTMREGNKVETPNVLATFRPSYNYESHLKSIRVIDNIIIRHKPFITNRGQPTCGNCQALGHTKRYCWRPQRCVRCSGNHSVENCKPETPLKCPNCQGNHPASYKQCPVRIHLLRKTLAGKSQAPIPRPVPRHPPPPPPSVWGLPQAQTASQRLFPRSHPPPPTIPQVQIPTNPTPSIDTAPRWVAEFTSTLTSMLNTLITTVQSLLSTLPLMLSK